MTPTPIRIPWIENVALQWESDECLRWPFSFSGGRKPGEYPALSGTYGHTYLCERVHGPRPPGHEVEHTCGHAWCMNRYHVKWATHWNNCSRRFEHGTELIGENHPERKLTEDEARVIKFTPHYYGIGRRLAEQFGVSTATVSLIRSDKAWRHLT